MMKINILSTLVTLPLLAWAQPVAIKNLVFEGGGVRGISFVGALQELEHRGVMPNIEKIGGTSVGAITALTVALGYSAHEIQEIIATTNPGKFNDGTFLGIGGMSRLIKHYGWYKGNSFTRWAEKIIEKKTGNPNITFMQLKQKGFKELYVTGTSLNRQQTIVFSHQTFPNMKVKDAVRISMSIPFYFQAVLIDSAGNVLNPKRATGKYDIMVDGGFTANFPIWIFDTVLPDGTRTPNPATIGFRLDTDEQIQYDKAGQGLAPVRVASFKNYIGAFFNYILENMNRPGLTPEDWARTVSIPANRVGPKIKKFSPAQIQGLTSGARTATATYLNAIKK